MEFPRSLLIVLALLSLGMCLDGATVFGASGSVRIVALALLAGRIAAIGGIMARNRTGWYVALAFFAVIIGLNLLAAQLSGAGMKVGIGIAGPIICLVILILNRNEFE